MPRETEGQTIESSDTIIPPAPGRDDNAGTVELTHNAELPPQAPAPASVEIDARSEASLAAQIQDTLQDALADSLGVGREILAVGAKYYAPLLARQAVMQASSDPAIKAKAAGHWRHLRGQFLMEAASKGIPLQQRHEERVLGVLTTVLSIGMRMLTGGVA